jgi:hypothetical protein
VVNCYHELWIIRFLKKSSSIFQLFMTSDLYETCFKSWGCYKNVGGEYSLFIWMILKQVKARLSCEEKYKDLL